MDELQPFQVLEYKTTNELFSKKFVFDYYDYRDKRDGFEVNAHIFMNSLSTEQLTLPVKYLEYMITRIIKQDEQ